MVFIRDYSIQDILRNINRRLSSYDIAAVLLLLGILLLTYTLLSFLEHEKRIPLTYNVAIGESKEEQTSKGLLFGSVSGKTYTFSWCQGSSRIKESNKIYFASEQEAKLSGRTLSKLCK